MGSEETAREAIADQAIEWLVRLDAGRADPDAFERWRGASPRHAAIFAQLAATWTKTGELRTAGVDVESCPPDIAFSGEEDWPGEEDGPDAQDRPPAGIGRRRMIGGLAATFVAAAALGTGTLLWDRRVFAETGVGERRIVVLPGGSRVELNTRSRLAWRTGDALELWLEQGEAAIAVPRDAVQRVMARADGLRAALGPGLFNLRLMDAGIRLMAISGSAEVTDRRGQAATLASGRMLQDRPEGLRTQPLDPVELEQASAWRQGEILFDGMTLAQAVGEFNRYLVRPMELGDPALAPIRLGGRFSTDDPQGFLQSLDEGFGIASRISGDRILLYSARSSG